jgi:photosystem II stability/assembly factor-like uncharacterized protein
MKKVIFIIGFILFFENGYSQSGWFQQYYSPTFENYQNSIFFIDSLTGWYHRQSYYPRYGIFKTTDGGNNWNMIDGSKGYITSIFFIDHNTGWMTVGDNSDPGGYDMGRIYKSTNSGLNWITQVIPVSEYPINYRHMTCIKFLNTNTGFSSGFIEYLSGQALLIDTYVLKTTNGGTNWNVIFRITTGDANNNPGWFRKLDFADENNIWVSGFLGHFYHTTNGGVNWINTVMYSQGSNFVDLKLINQNTGYVLSSYY